LSLEVLSTGWYCDDSGMRDYCPQGSDLVRQSEFRPTWWASVNTFLKPAHVFVVDSASPTPIDDSVFTSTSIQQLRLTINPGHAQNAIYHYCGWMASVLLGLEYTLACGADYFLYVEQDALVYGRDFVDRIEQALIRSRYVFGSGEGTYWPLQQSVFAIRKDGIRPFLQRIHGIPYCDRDVSPEVKFALASGISTLRYWLGRAFLWPALGSPLRYGIGMRLAAMAPGFATLPFGYGRRRPISFDDPCFYFQHGSLHEIAAYRKKIGMDGSSDGRGA
jgi:hypothetical protein